MSKYMIRKRPIGSITLLEQLNAVNHEVKEGQGGLKAYITKRKRGQSL